MRLDLSRMNDPETQSTYLLLGGETALRELVDRFYHYMDTLAEAKPIRKLHPPDLAGSADKLFKFLSGWLGGPNLYQEEFGHPRLRMRHFPFSIGPAESEQWLLCMRQALDDVPMDTRFREHLFEALSQTARHMINRPQ